MKLDHQKLASKAFYSKNIDSTNDITIQSFQMLQLVCNGKRAPIYSQGEEFPRRRAHQVDKEGAPLGWNVEPSVWE
jgi:hypothetical protein